MPSSLKGGSQFNICLALSPLPPPPFLPRGNPIWTPRVEGIFMKAATAERGWRDSHMGTGGMGWGTFWFFWRGRVKAVEKSEFQSFDAFPPSNLFPGGEWVPNNNESFRSDTPTQTLPLFPRVESGEGGRKKPIREGGRGGEREKRNWLVPEGRAKNRGRGEERKFNSNISSSSCFLSCLESHSCEDRKRKEKQAAEKVSS